MASLRISELTQRTPDGTEYLEVIIDPFTPGTNRKVLLQDALDLITTGTGTVDTIVAGTNITVDSTDPANPIVSATAGDSLDLAVPSTAGGTITLDLNSQKQR